MNSWFIFKEKYTAIPEIWQKHRISQYDHNNCWTSLRDHSGRHKINKEPIIYAFGLTHGLPSHYWRLFESAPCLSPNCSYSKKRGWQVHSWAINGEKYLVEYNFSVKSISRKILWNSFHGKSSSLHCFSIFSPLWAANEWEISHPCKS